MNRIFLILLLLGVAFSAQAQDYFQLTGKVKDENGNEVPFAHVKILDTYLGTTSDEHGEFKLHLVRREKYTVHISFVGYKEKEVEIVPEEKASVHIEVVLDLDVNILDEVSVKSLYSKSSNLAKISVKEIEMVPNASGSIESLIKTLPGVSSNSELSSQYSVRGGNFDENLVYVNGIEIFRPLLIRSGQQEGLSFVNSDMVSSINFSAGGFDARFGDKMSSVLDIQYKRPTEFGGKVSGSLLGGSLHLEDALGKNNQFAYNIGMRYKTSKYLLNSLEVEGDYNPSFYDVQAFLTYKPNKYFSVDFLGNYALNNYDFTPKTRHTQFGTFQNSLGLTVYYQGNEKDRFENGMSAVSFNYNNGDKLSMKLTGSMYKTNESESFDIIGHYNLNELDKTIGSETYGDSILNLAEGSFHNHARNNLDVTVYTISLKGGYYWPNNELRWGLDYSIEEIDNQIREYTRIDSAGYSKPYTGSEIVLFESARANNVLYNSRFTAFIQDVYQFRTGSGDYFLNAGVRCSYWDFSDQFLVSPRILLSYNPFWSKNLSFRLSGGYYYQPPFYKEIKNDQGEVNKDIKAQKSIHAVLGMDYYFKAWDRPFKLTAEAYYKWMNDLIPYRYDNVRIEYSGDNLAKGYAYGIDLKVNGEFVQGIESWASLSLMKTEEDIQGDLDDNGNSIGYYRRPTDQLMNFSMYFQDYLPRNPTYTMQLSVHYGTNLPVASPNKDRYDLIYKLPSYKRVDMGFSKVFDRNSRFLSGKLMSNLEKFIVSIEIFNVLGINNTNSVLWIQTVNNQTGDSGYYAVPNYLTSRRLNVKLTARF